MSFGEDHLLSVAARLKTAPFAQLKSAALLRSSRAYGLKETTMPCASEDTVATRIRPTGQDGRRVTVDLSGGDPLDVTLTAIAAKMQVKSFKLTCKAGTWKLKLTGLNGAKVTAEGKLETVLKAALANA